MIVLGSSNIAAPTEDLATEKPGSSENKDQPPDTPGTTEDHDSTVVALIQLPKGRCDPKHYISFMSFNCDKRILKCILQNEIGTLERYQLLQTDEIRWEFIEN